MRVRPVLESLWMIVALGLAWIGGAVGGYAGLRFGLAYGGLFLLALVWGTLLRGYGAGGRRLATVFQTIAAGGPIAAVAITVSWPVLFSWFSYELEGWGFLCYLATAVIIGLVTALFIYRGPARLLSGSEPVFPEARAVAGVFVNRWRAEEGHWPSPFFRGALIGLASRLCGRLLGLFPEVVQGGAAAYPGWSAGLAVSPCYFGIGGLIGKVRAGELLAGSLVSAACCAVLLAAAAPGNPAVAAANSTGTLFGAGAVTAAAVVGGIAELRALLKRQPRLAAPLGAVAAGLFALTGWLVTGPEPARIALLTLSGFALATTVLMTALGYLGLIGAPTGPMLAALAALPALLGGLWRPIGAPAAAGLSMAIIGAITAAGCVQSFRTGVYLAGPGALSARTTFLLQAAGVAAGFAGALWAALITGDGAAFGSAGFPSGYSPLVGAVLASLRTAFAPSVILAGAVCVLAVELLGRRARLFALGALLPFPVALAVASGAWLTGVQPREARAQTIASGLVAGDLLGLGALGFAVGWGYLTLPEPAAKPVWALVNYALIVGYVAIECSKRRGISAQTEDTLAIRLAR